MSQEIKNFYICRVCTASYEEDVIDCPECNHKRCVLLYMEETVQKSIASMKKQSSIDISLLMPILSRYIRHNHLIESIVSDIIDEDVPTCGDGFRCGECTVCARTEPCECGCGLLGGTCDDWLKESYMECAECGETVPNNMCEFVDEEMEVVMCRNCMPTHLA